MKIIRPEAPLNPNPQDAFTVAGAQISPVWLDREASLAKVEAAVRAAAGEGAGLVCFGEALVPGYPFWTERTDGARFESDLQKDYYALYLDQAVVIERGDLERVQAAAREGEIAVYLGIIERAPDRGGHSCYCSLVFIGQDGEIGSVQRKLQPTYDERLVWAQGDGAGLVCHTLGPFTAGGLNCWENWLPLARAALYGQGEDLHVGVWPGGPHNTKDITRFAAREGRSFMLSVSGVMRPGEVGEHVPEAERLRAETAPFARGGSCLAGPDGEFLIPPIGGEEALLVATLDHAFVRRERQNMDVAGHYSRPDVLRLEVDRRRQSTVNFRE